MLGLVAWLCLIYHPPFDTFFLGPTNKCFFFVCFFTLSPPTPHDQGVNSGDDFHCLCFSGFMPDWNGVVCAEGPLGTVPATCTSNTATPTIVTSEIEACNHKISEYCFLQDNGQDVTLGSGSQLGADGKLEIVVYVDVEANSYVRSISVGGDDSDCVYPSPETSGNANLAASNLKWIKTFSDTSCRDKFTSNIPVSMLTVDGGAGNGCSIPRPFEATEPCTAEGECEPATVGLVGASGRSLTQESRTTKWLIYTFDTKVVVVRRRPSLADPDSFPVVYTEVITETLLRTITSVPSEIVVTFANLQITSDHDLRFVLTKQAWIVGTELVDAHAEITIETIVRWPYEIDALAVTATPDADLITASVDESLPHTITCADDAYCQQAWVLSIFPSSLCEINGDYHMSAAFSCRDEAIQGGSCTASTETFTVENLDGTEICAVVFLDETNKISATLAAYDQDCVEAKNEFYLGTTACFIVTVTSTGFAVDSVDLDYAVAYLASQSPPEAIALDDNEVSGTALNEARFNVYFTAGAFPFTTQGETDTYVVLASVTVGYDDGAKRRSAAFMPSVRAAASTVIPSTAVAMTNDPTKVVTPGTGVNAGAGTLTTPGTTAGLTTGPIVALVGAGLFVALVAGLYVVVAVRKGGKGGKKSTKDDETEYYYDYYSDEAASTTSAISSSA